MVGSTRVRIGPLTSVRPHTAATLLGPTALRWLARPSGGEAALLGGEPADVVAGAVATRSAR